MDVKLGHRIMARNHPATPRHTTLRPDYRVHSAVRAKNGADDGIRTRDLRFTKPLLYQLSYVGAGGKDYIQQGEGQARRANLFGHGLNTDFHG